LSIGRICSILQHFDRYADERPLKARVLALFTRLRERDLVPLIVLGSAALAIFGFLKLASEIQEGETHAIDLAILHALRQSGRPDLPIGPLWLQQAALDITSLGSVTVLSFLLFGAMGYLLLIRKTQNALLLAASAGGGWLLSSVLKELYDRPRPDLVPEAVAHLNPSFPSGHAMLSAVIYLTLAALLMRTQANPKVKAYLLGLALTATFLVGLTRIYLGLHWPTDVVGGWSLGAGWAILCRVTADHLPRLFGRS
jgi:undecaprenyl-diphosphatase